MNRGALIFTLVTAAMITQWAGAEVRGAAAPTPPPFSGVKPAAAPAPTWGTKKGCNPLREGESKPRCWDDTKEFVVGANRGQEDEVAKWLRSFDMVVVIDKADQRETAYINTTGDKENVQLGTIMDKAKISTGGNDETRDCDNEKAAPDAQGIRWVTATEPIYRHTPTGYFVVRAIKSDYFSRKYKSEMPLAVAIDEEEGTYNHVRPEGNCRGDGKSPASKNSCPQFQLGDKASHGCIREGKKEAAHIFAAVATTGVINPSDDNFRAHCWHGKDGKDPCEVDQNRDLELQNYARELAQGKITGFNVDNPRSPIDVRGKLPVIQAPYTENNRPEVLVVHKNGTIEVDPQTGGAVTSSKAFNTLYIVKDSTLQTGTPFQPPPQIECTVDGENAKIAAANHVAPPSSGGGFGGSSSPVGDFFSFKWLQPQRSR